MGGRKSHRVEKVIGSNLKIKNDIKKLKESLENQDPKGITNSTVQMVKDSSLAINNLSCVFYFYDLLSTFPEKKPYNERRKIISEFWLKTKKKNNIETSSAFDKIIIDSATKMLGKGGVIEK